MTTQPTTRLITPHDRPSDRVGPRVGQALTVLVSLFLAFDAIGHVLKVSQVVAASRSLGFDPDVMRAVGILELLLLLLYLVPRTSLIGAVLLTGYLGGAVSAQLRIDAPLLSTLLFPVYIGVVVWVGLWLRGALGSRWPLPRR
jgi:membrane protein DedA with SNARE-associated domain